MTYMHVNPHELSWHSSRMIDVSVVLIGYINGPPFSMWTDVQISMEEKEKVELKERQLIMLDSFMTKICVSPSHEHKIS